ncbi:hypothetical protein CAEBREN_23343 [Caenorhabditis brenneri]|uniref:Uncharacterized protein n=1 Tax=Caenorhabditis brenneri TaxID=135651 RepID=G0N552_CAEBE|nr:hypothetical protein CAEBREN_23343 [Caenorhabditis brenneri]
MNMIWNTVVSTLIAAIIVVCIFPTASILEFGLLHFITIGPVKLFTYTIDEIVEAQHGH